MTLNLNLGLAGFPFRLQTSPAEAVPHRSWLHAREAALAALGRSESVAILGRPGTGKTLLLQSLFLALREQGRRPGLPGELNRDVVIVDEAGAMPLGELIALRQSGKLYVLAALPDASLPMPATRVPLHPLSPEDVARVIGRRLSAAGRSCNYFDPEAIVELTRQSGGLMRLVLVLAGAATFHAEHEGVPRVTRQHVRDAAFMRDVLRCDEPLVLASAD